MGAAKPIKERTVLAPAYPRCRRPGCPRQAMCRDLCLSDYQVAYQLVSSGVTSWEELQQKGKASEPRRSAKQWFLNK